MSSNGNFTGLVRRDLSPQCLVGKLGEICRRRMGHFPRAYAWPAILACASAKIDEHTRINEYSRETRSNLYVGLVGGLHSGKTQAIDYATTVMGLERPVLMKAQAGSGEALLRQCAKAAGNPRLFAPDELGHTLKKIGVEGAGFAHNLCTAFDQTEFSLYLGKKEIVEFNCHLSILGGVVEERFSDLFDYQSTEGLYDRFLFGLSPGKEFFSEPITEAPETIQPKKEVYIDPEVYFIWARQFRKDNPDVNPRVMEIAIRVALICAAFDGQRLVTNQSMQAQEPLIFEQTHLRKYLLPNPGETPEGRIHHRLQNYLEQQNGTWISARDLYRNTHIARISLSGADRVTNVMLYNGDWEESKIGKVRMLRIPPLKNEGENEQEK